MNDFWIWLNTSNYAIGIISGIITGIVISIITILWAEVKTRILPDNHYNIAGKWEESYLAIQPEYIEEPQSQKLIFTIHQMRGYIWGDGEVINLTGPCKRREISLRGEIRNGFVSFRFGFKDQKHHKALASYLLKIVDDDEYGFHLEGDSSCFDPEISKIISHHSTLKFIETKLPDPAN